MKTFWVSNVYVLLFVTYFGNAQYFDYFDDSNPCPSYPLVFKNDPCIAVPNITIPCIPLPQPNPVPSDQNGTAAIPAVDGNCSVINPNGSLANGNSLFIIVDPKSLQAILQVVTPCNKTDTPPSPVAGPLSPPAAAVPPATGGSLVPGSAADLPVTGNNPAPRPPATVDNPTPGEITPPASPPDTGSGAPAPIPQGTPLVSPDDDSNTGKNAEKVAPPVKRHDHYCLYPRLPRQVPPDPNVNLPDGPPQVPDTNIPADGPPPPSDANAPADGPPPVPDTNAPPDAPPPVPDANLPADGPPPVPDTNVPADGPPSASDVNPPASGSLPVPGTNLPIGGPPSIPGASPPNEGLPTAPGTSLPIGGLPSDPGTTLPIGGLPSDPGTTLPIGGLPSDPGTTLPIGGPPSDPGTTLPIGGPPSIPGVSPPNEGLPPLPAAPNDNGENPQPAGAPFDNAIPPPPTTPGGLLCNLLTLIQTLVNAILQFVLNLLKQLVNLIIRLLKSIIRSVLGKLLPDVLKTLQQLLGTLVPNLLGDVQKLLNNTLTDLLGAHGLVPDLVRTIAGGSAPLTGPIANATTGIITNVENLLKDLLEVPVVDTVQLVSNISILLNNTLEDLLDDVDKLADDLLTDLLGNSSLVVVLTRDVTTLLKNVLGDKVCNVEKLLTNSNSLGQLIQNLLELIRNLLDDVLRDVDKLLVNKLVKVLGKRGILDKLLDNILKLLTDLLNNLLAPKLKKLRDSTIVKNPEQFKTEARNNVTSLLGGPINLVSGNLIGPQLDVLLNNLIRTVQNLLKNLENLLANKNNGLLTNLINTIRNLLNTLLNNLSREVGVLLPPQLSNLINPSALLGPLGTVVTNILKLVVCDSCNNSTTPVTPPPVTDVPPVTTSPTIPPVTIAPLPGTNSSLPCIPFYYPIPTSCEYVEDTLFDNINDPDSFASGLNIFQDYINRKICDSIGGDYGDSIVDSLLGTDFRDCRDSDDGLYPFNFEALPNRLINGLEGTKKLTSNVATSGLWNLINALSNTTSSSASPTIPLPPITLPGSPPQQPPPGSPPQQLPPTDGI